MRWKDERIGAEFRSLEIVNPTLLVVLLFADYLAAKLFNQQVTITSLYRNDGSPHADDLAADCRILNLDRDLRPDAELDLNHWITLRELINAAFSGKDNPKSVNVCRIHIDDHMPTNTHVHLQVPRTTVWR